MNIGTKLRELREARGLTQDQLAGLSGLPAGTVRNYEQGRREPSWEAVWALAEALGVGRGLLYETFRGCVGAAPAPAAKVGRPPKNRADAEPPPTTPAPPPAEALEDEGEAGPVASTGAKLKRQRARRPKGK
jgi:transcriptional regulator with XRE-family HTH domain